jgi:hypothetical protein
MSHICIIAVTTTLDHFITSTQKPCIRLIASAGSPVHTCARNSGSKLEYNMQWYDCVVTTQSIQHTLLTLCHIAIWQSLAFARSPYQCINSILLLARSWHCYDCTESGLEQQRQECTGLQTVVSMHQLANSIAAVVREHF